MSKPVGLYLGKSVDPTTGALGAEVRLDPADLTTHAVVIGMTGSGKTGLCIDLLEEAALAGIPTLVIDPKGDIGNLLLTFPDLRPEDFAPWLPPGEAERKGLTAHQYAEKVAESWRTGLAEWGLDGQRIRELREKAEITLYTPGSRSGVPVDVLSSFTPPDLSWETEEEALRESIRFSVSAVLALLGIEAEPLQSREHIFLSHLVEDAWRKGAPCDLGALIRGLQSPPFDQLGVFAVESFYPIRERMKLAVALNGILAAPAFEPWMQGQALDPASILRAPDGKSRIGVFYLGHLSEREKLFFTTLLLSSANAWMRQQGGTTDLRALVYIDEALGMIPPYPANPPTKEILLLLMKQARAFGMGLVLTTQNPVDIDYKVLTNAGTWFIGRLQTQQDKDRVLEGLVGQGGAGASRAELDARIGGLPQRSFLLYSAKGAAPRLMKSRWALSYLRGPLTKEEIARLTAGERGRPSEPAARAASPQKTAGRAQATAEPAPAQAGPIGAAQAVLTQLEAGSHVFLTVEGLRGLGAAEPAPDFVAGSRFVPGLYAVANLRYDESRAGLNVTERAERLVFPLPADAWSWAASRPVELGPGGTAASPSRPGTCEPLPAGILRKGALAALRKAFADHLLNTAVREMYHAPELALYSRYDESRAQFEERITGESAGRGDAEVAKLRDKYATKLSALQRKVEKERSDVTAAASAHEGRKREELVSGAESVFGFILGRKGTRAISQASRQRRMTETAGLKAERERREAAATESDLQALSGELEAEVGAIEQRYAGKSVEIRTLDVPLERDDVRLETFGILWIPVP